MAWTVKRGVPARSSDLRSEMLKPSATSGPESIDTLCGHEWNGASDFSARFTTERTLGEKRSVSNSAARLPVRHFRRRQRLRTSPFFSRHKQMSNIHARLCSTWRIPRTEVMTSSPPTVFPAKVTPFSSCSHLARHASWQKSLRYTTSTCQQAKKKKKKKARKAWPEHGKIRAFRSRRKPHTLCLSESAAGTCPHWKRWNLLCKPVSVVPVISRVRVEFTSDFNPFTKGSLPALSPVINLASPDRAGRSPASVTDPNKLNGPKKKKKR